MSQPKLKADLFQQHSTLSDQCWLIAKDMFLKLQAGHTIHDHNEERSDDAFHPAKGYAFSDFEFTKKGVVLRGDKYVGCGETYYVSVSIPFDRIDSLDEYIRELQAARAEAQRRRRATRMAEKAVEQEQQKQRERAKYEELKAKFEGEQV